MVSSPRTALLCAACACSRSTRCPQQRVERSGRIPTGPSHDKSFEPRKPLYEYAICGIDDSDAAPARSWPSSLVARSRTVPSESRGRPDVLVIRRRVLNGLPCWLALPFASERTSALPPQVQGRLNWNRVPACSWPMCYIGDKDIVVRYRALHVLSDRDPEIVAIIISAGSPVCAVGHTQRRLRPSVEELSD